MRRRRREPKITLHMLGRATEQPERHRLALGLVVTVRADRQSWRFTLCRNGALHVARPPAGWRIVEYSRSRLVFKAPLHADVIVRELAPRSRA